MNESSPWKTIQFEDQANALDVDFIDDNHGFLVGSNRLIWNLLMVVKHGKKDH